MKQVVQRLKDGRIDVLDVPEPICSPDEVLVDVRASVISAGTERTKVVTGRKNLLGKARSRPDQVRKVMDKARRDGIGATVSAVRMRLEAPASLGYSASGVVVQVGERVAGVLPGDRVCCAGADYAVHADVVRVPGNLCVKLPDHVELEHAAFATVGAIALHGVRQTDARLGERIAVIGMGLVGQLAGQLLRAAGCSVVGIDLSEDLLKLARSSGAADETFPRSALEGPLPPVAADCDAVLITAAAPNNDPINLAAELARDRARVVVLGDVQMDVPRAIFYEKELELRLSRSYGPGRYDTQYEQRGLDYPIGYVRWTEHRNLQAFVELLRTGRVNVEPLITERIPVDDAPEAYERLAGGSLSPLGIVITYEPRTERAPAALPTTRTSSLRIGMIGCGSFAQRVLIPALRETGFELAAVASQTGLSARAAVEQFGFERVDEVEGVLNSEDIDLVVIASGHSSHAALAVAALRSGKHVFVEKPPALTVEELASIRDAADASGLHVTVGFNRRHAPMAVAARSYVREGGEPVDLLFRVNAGQLPRRHWLNDLDEGGGRLVGEGCHFIDFACWFIGGLPTKIDAIAGPSTHEQLAGSQSFAVSLGFADGSTASVMYSSRGSDRLGKEYIEAHSATRSAVIRDFKALDLYDGAKGKQPRPASGKGHVEQFRELRHLLAGDSKPSLPSGLQTMAVTFVAASAAGQLDIRRGREA